MPEAVAPALEVTDLRKSFGGVHALRGVDFAIEAGEVHALLGHNGAGKSTLINALGGAYAADSGSIVVGGRSYAALTPRQSIDAGIAIIYQRLSLVGALTVADNIFLGRELRERGIVNRKAQEREAAQVLERLGATCRPHDQVDTLAMGQRQLVEIAKAMVREPTVLILDEPTAALSAHEISALERMVQRLKEQGLAICYVTHLLGEVERLADRVTVLSDGQVHFHAATAGLTRSDLVAAIAEPVDSTRPDPPGPDAAVRLALSGLTGDRIGPVDLAVREGEVVGLFGLIGSGRTRTLETVYGARASTGGSVVVDGAGMPPRGVRARTAAGLALVPGDRARQGLFASLTARTNVLLPVLTKLSRYGIRQRSAENTAFDEVAAAVGLRPPRGDLPASSYSGGNQQKLLLGRWVGAQTATKVLLLDEPTQGVDVRARAEIYDVVHGLAGDRGTAVLFASTDPEEVVALAHRALIMAQGQIVAEISGADLTEEALLHAIQHDPEVFDPQAAQQDPEPKPLAPSPPVSTGDDAARTHDKDADS